MRRVSLGHTSHAGEKRRQWSTANMKLVLQACRGGTMSQRAASIALKVPRKILCGPLNGLVLYYKPVLGNLPALTAEDL